MILKVIRLSSHLALSLGGLITFAQTTLKKDEIVTIYDYEWRYVRGCDDYHNM